MIQRIDEMSIEQICDEYGILTARELLINALERHNQNEERINEFLKKFYPLNNFLGETQLLANGTVGRRISFDAMKKMMCEYQDIFDVKAYAYELFRMMIDGTSKVDLNGNFKSAKNSSIAIVASPIITKNGRKNPITKEMELKKLLKSIDIITDSKNIRINDENFEAEIITSQDILGNSKSVQVKNKQTERRWKKIEETIPQKELAYYIIPSDLIDGCRYPLLGVELSQFIRDMPFDSTVKMERTNIVTKEVTEYDPEKEKIKRENMYAIDNLCKVLNANIKYMDLDKLLVMALENYYLAFIDDLEARKYEDALRLKEFASKVEKCVVDKSITFKRSRNGASELTSYEYIKSEIDKILARYIDNTLHTPEEVSQIREEILIGKRGYTTILYEEYVNAMKFDENELFQIVEQDPEALEYFLTTGLIEEKTAKEFVEKADKIRENTVLALYSNNIISNNNLLELYQANKISLESIKLIKESVDKPEELEEIVSIEKLVSLYNNPDKKEKFERYRRLFKLLKIDGKSIEEKNTLSIEILDTSNQLLEDEK